MIKPVLALAAVGLVGILFLPVILFVLKIALIGGLILLAFWWFNKKNRKDDTPPPVSE
jgi:cyanate permease